MQWRGWTCLYTLVLKKADEQVDLRQLNNDLRNLDQWIRQTDDKIAKFTANEPISQPPDGGPNSTPLAHHAWQHVTVSSLNSSINAGQDLITPYPITWDRGHTWAPVAADVVPITINLAADQTADALNINTNDGTRIFTVDNANAVGINEDNPLAHLVVQATDFDPITLDPIAWWKADSLSLNDNDNVTSWLDSSGHGHHLSRSSSTDVTYQTNELNTLPIVRVANESGMNLVTPVSISGGLTVFWVYKMGNDGGDLRMLFDGDVTGTNFLAPPSLNLNNGGTGNCFLWVVAGSTSLTLVATAGLFGVGVGAFDNAAGVTWNTHHLFTYSMPLSRASAAGRLDGTAKGGVVSGYPAPTGTLSITDFLNFSGGSTNNVDVAEVIVFDVELSADDILNVEAYLNAKYNLNGGGSGAAALAYVQTWQDSHGNIKDQVDSSFKWGINADPSVRFHVIDTVEQVRVGYDISNYLSVTVSSGGDVVFAPTGGDAAITGNLSVSGTFNTAATKFSIDILGDVVKLKNLTYSWPSAHVASGLLTNNGSGTLAWSTAATLGLVSGTGTLNTLPKWTPDGVTLGDSNFTDTGTLTATSKFFGVKVASPLVPLHLLDAQTTAVTEPTSGLKSQARFGYDASNYYFTSVATTGAVTWGTVTAGAASSSGVGFNFNNLLRVTNPIAGDVPFRIMMAASQTGRSFEIRNSGGSLLIGMEGSKGQLIMLQSVTATHAANYGTVYTKLFSSRAELTYLDSDGTVGTEIQITKNKEINLPLTTQGDLLTRSSTVLSRLAIGATGDVLTVAGGLPAWAAPALSSPVTAVQGGTGQTSYTVGDVLYASSTTALSKLGIGSSGQILTVAAGLPSWAAPSAAPVTSVFGRTGAVVAVTNDYSFAQISGTAAATQGGTGQTVYAVGDLLFASTTTALSKLADIATGNALISGGVGVAPSWGKIALTTHVSGTLPIANGGTNSPSALSGSTIMVSNGTGIIQGTAGTTTTVLHGNAAGTPTYSAVSLTADVSGILPIANGGTGASSGIYLPLAGGTMVGKTIYNMPGLGATNVDPANPTKNLGTEAVLFDQQLATASQRNASDFMRFRCTGNNGADVHGDFRVFADPGINNSLSLSCLHFQSSSDTTDGLDGTWLSRFKIFRDGGSVLIGTVIQLGDSATGSYAEVTNNPSLTAFSVHAFSGSTGNIQDWWDNAGNLVTSIDAGGAWTFQNPVAGIPITIKPYLGVGGYSAGVLIMDDTDSYEALTLGNDGVQFLGADTTSGILAQAYPIPTAAGTINSPSIIQTAYGFDTVRHTTRWGSYVNVTSNAGASTWTLRNALDTIFLGGTDVFSVGNDGLVTVTNRIVGLTNPVNPQDADTKAARDAAIAAYAQPLDADLTQIAAVANVQGDLLLTDATPTWVRLGIGANLTVLTSNGTTASWVAPAAAVVGANPTGTIGVAAVNGSATTYLRSDGAPAFDMTIARNWTAGVHTFSALDVHNAGVSLGTSGRLDSSVADAAAAYSFLLKPTVGQTSGTDRFIYGLQNSAGTIIHNVLSNLHQGFGQTADATNQVYTFQLPAGDTAAILMGGSPSLTGAGNTILGQATTVANTNFGVLEGASATWTNVVGAAFGVNASVARSKTGMWGGWFQANHGTGASVTVTEMGGIKVFGNTTLATMTPTITDWYGVYIQNTTKATNARGIYIEEMNPTTGGTIENGIFLANATSGYKAIAIRDQASWIGSNAANELNLSGASFVSVDAGDLRVTTAGKGLQIKEGSNAKMGTATLVLGTVVVSTTAVTASSRIQLTAQSLGTVTVPTALAVSARTAGTSFTILSSNLTDTSVVAWLIVEPA